MGTLKISELKQYIFRKLGHPVIRVEVDDSQLDDCVDEALKTFTESHYDACNIGFLGLEVSAGSNEYTLPDSIQSVMECLNIEGTGSSSLWIDDEPLLILRPGFNGQGGGGYGDVDGYFDVTSVEVMRQRMALWEDTYKTHILFEFNEVTKKLTFPSTPTRTGTRILHVIQSAVDTEDTDTVSDSLWLKKYSVALARIQWGVNLGKYDGAQLPGGVTVNASGILEKGEADKEKLLIELEEKYSEPPDPVYA
jgi:hypothetical protein